MKSAILILLILLVFVSCSSKQKTQSAFKLSISGRNSIEIFFAGGAYVEATDSTTSISTRYVLDDTNSVSIPYGTYNLLVVTFAGPDKNSGQMLCGSTPSTNLNSPDATLTITLSATECNLTKYANLIISLKQGIVPLWNNDRWDLSKWGP
jgi:hypothetical protein